MALELLTAVRPITAHFRRAESPHLKRVREWLRASRELPVGPPMANIDSIFRKLVPH